MQAITSMNKAIMEKSRTYSILPPTNWPFSYCPWRYPSAKGLRKRVTLESSFFDLTKSAILSLTKALFVPGLKRPSFLGHYSPNNSPKYFLFEIVQSSNEIKLHRRVPLDVIKNSRNLIHLSLINFN